MGSNLEKARIAALDEEATKRPVFLGIVATMMDSLIAKVHIISCSSFGSVLNFGKHVAGMAVSSVALDLAGGCCDETISSNLIFAMDLANGDSGSVVGACTVAMAEALEGRLARALGGSWFAPRIGSVAADAACIRSDLLAGIVMAIRAFVLPWNC